jgi:cell division protein FtsL
MKKFIEEKFTIIVLVIMLLMFFKSCSDSREISKIRKEITTLEDSTYNKKELDIRLQIEGLKSEKRMIQSTDRKILDVTRQTQIDQEITTLEGKLK